MGILNSINDVDSLPLAELVIRYSVSNGICGTFDTFVPVTLKDALLKIDNRFPDNRFKCISLLLRDGTEYKLTGRLVDNKTFTYTHD